jgi:putative ABC transport system permease protein
MGMKKGKVARGLLYEMGALTVVCLVLGLVAGTIAAQPVADNLLQQQVAAVERVEQQGGFRPGGMVGGMQVFNPMATTPEVEPLSEISVRLDIDVMLQIAAIALLLAFIASAMGILNITRYEPIKILMERD